MRLILMLLVLGWSTTFVVAQDAYFQQWVNMEIKVQLDDEKHQLNGWWSMKYENRSPDTLTFIYMHLWPNAYQDRTTAFAQQMLRSGDTEFYFAPEGDLGFMDSLSFSAAGEPLEWKSTEMGPDVVQLWLAEPLLPGAQIRIESPMRLQFPASFSRLGHVGQSYQVTQWFPKPAVYDQDGWHPMPYLDYGEYYSEFMPEINVYLTVPENYVVAATGELQTEEELAWLREKAAADAQQRWSGNDPVVYAEAEFPESSTNFKHLHFRANWVHDFAWFADKRFHVLHDTVQIAKREPVEVWSYFTDQQAHLWQHSITYLKRSTRFYSDHVGPYAYPQVSAVQSALSAGGGMEYPMITVIGLEPDAHQLDLVLAHEVGHNWFYGILATNERDHAWLDEGFNSYYEHRYDQKYYGEAGLFPGWFQGGSSIGLDQVGYRYYGCQRLSQAPDTPAEKLRFYNYWIGAYSVPSLALQQLEGYWGKHKLDEVVQRYYHDWQYKHPRPQDVQESMEKYGGEPLGWFFQGFMASTDLQDYSIKEVTGEAVIVENKGEVQAPYCLQTISVAGDTSLRWYPAPPKDDSWKVGLPAGPYQSVRIDPNHQTLEVEGRNNHWRKGWGKLEPPRLRLISGLKNEVYNDVFVAPLAGYNLYDGTLLGIGLTNRGILPQPIEWYAAPMYALETKSWTGSGGLRARIWKPAEARALREATAYGHYSTFNFATLFEDPNFPLRYNRIEVGTTFRYHSLGESDWLPTLNLRYIGLRTEDYIFSVEGELLGTEKVPGQIVEAAFSLKRDWVLSPARFSLTSEYASYRDGFDRDQNHLKLMLEGRGKMLFQEEKAFHWRIFAGFFLNNSVAGGTFTPAQAFSLFDRGQDDYRFDNLYFGRTATSGGASQQLGLRAGGFRAPVPASFGVGRSNKNMISVNLGIDVPFTPSWLPLRPYLDAATFAAPTFDGDENQFLWTGGLALEWLDGRVGVYLPLTGSSEIMDRLKERGDLGQRIGFRLLLTELAPWKWLDELRSW